MSKPSQPGPGPLDPLREEDLERFMVRHPAEIEQILRALVRDAVAVTLYGDAGRRFVVSRLLAIDPTAGALFLDWGPVEADNAAILESERVVAVAMHQHVRTQFESPGASRGQDAKGPLIVLRWPKQILRLQRRESYRLVTSLTHPVRCLIPLETGELQATVTDISVGGLSALFPSGAAQLSVGNTYSGGQLLLPDASPLPVSLNVRSLSAERLKNGTLATRAGCQFVELAPSVETAIQRYILKVERARRALLG